ncbi:MAG: toll/interleukin-1 receptor domain-containing protein [Burkholderiales bacterium]|nr:toll/interleukin-1 receptor domain-containing protein [Burkholderiales bacterium]
MNDAAPRWTFFIAHAKADLEPAEALYELLAPHALTFLDSRCIEFGDDWDQLLAQAQRDARISVILVSSRSGSAYYQREEIAEAIALARTDDRAHRVVPVYLDGEAAQAKSLYGLRLKHGLQLGDDLDIDGVAKALLGMVERLGHPPLPGARPPPLPHLPWWRRRSTWAASGGVVALAAGLAVWQGMPPSVPDADQGPQPPNAPTVTAAGAECLVTDALTPNVLPHYLMNSFGSDNFPYWLRINIENGCPSRKGLSVRFENSGSVTLTSAPQVKPFYIDPGENFGKTFTPDFSFGGTPPDRITIKWSLEDDVEHKLVEGEINTEIVPPKTVAWDLRKPARGGAQGEKVEDAFLLGSLKAWILKPPPEILKLGRGCRRAPGQTMQLEREDAIRNCYEQLFRGEHSIPVSPSPMINFPASDRQSIRAPKSFIEHLGSSPSSLEAALLFVATFNAAHKAGIDPDLVLVIGPAPSGPANSKTAYIAWQLPASPWRALNMQAASENDFAANADTASTQVAQLLEAEAPTRKAAGEHGAAFSADRRMAVVDFANVPTRYQIHGLP